jgi:hypothetical protein
MKSCLNCKHNKGAYDSNFPCDICGPSNFKWEEQLSSSTLRRNLLGLLAKYIDGGMAPWEAVQVVQGVLIEIEPSANKTEQGEARRVLAMKISESYEN